MHKVVKSSSPAVAATATNLVHHILSEKEMQEKQQSGIRKQSITCVEGLWG